jgi:hypothetical protein
MRDETFRIDSSCSGGFRFPNHRWPIVYLEIGAIRTRDSYVQEVVIVANGIWRCRRLKRWECATQFWC